MVGVRQRVWELLVMYLGRWAAAVDRLRSCLDENML